MPFPRFAPLLLLLAACGSSPAEDPTADAGSPALPVDAGPPTPCEAVEPNCSTQMPSQLRFGTSVAFGDVTNTHDGSDWQTDVDAASRGGGFGGGARSSYLYARF